MTCLRNRAAGFTTELLTCLSHKTGVLRTPHITDTKTAQLIVIIAIGLLHAFQKDTAFMNTIGVDFGTSNTAAMTASMLCNIEKWNLPARSWVPDGQRFSA